MIKLYYKNTYIAEVNTDLEFPTVQDMLLYLHLSLEDLTTILDEKLTVWIISGWKRQWVM